MTAHDFTPKDEAFSAVLSAFVALMRAPRKSEEERRLGREFNRLCDEFFEAYPDASLADLASGLVQLGVPYEQAFRDLTWARGVS
jgi:hypothetical protein